MAYVLGFFTADGSMYRTRRGGYFIEFQITDGELLNRIKETIGSRHVISIRGATQDSRKARYRLQIGSKKLFSDLLRIGLTPNKSKTVLLPVIPFKYFSSFVRGYFDGDGNVTIAHYKRADRKNKGSTTLLSGFISGSKKFIEKLWEKLRERAGIRGGTLYHHDGAHRLYFSIKDSRALYKFMYANSDDQLFLTRKRRVFEKYFKIA